MTSALSTSPVRMVTFGGRLAREIAREIAIDLDRKDRHARRRQRQRERARARADLEEHVAGRGRDGGDDLRRP